MAEHISDWMDQPTNNIFTLDKDEVIVKKDRIDSLLTLIQHHIDRIVYYRDSIDSLELLIEIHKSLKGIKDSGYVNQ